MATIAVLIPAFAAQPAPEKKVYRIGFVSPLSTTPTLEAFQQGLRDLGYVIGGSVVVEARFAEGHPERFPRLIDEFVRSRVDVLVVGSTLGVQAARRTRTTIPIVFAGVIDPISTGIVASLARPGGNMTGVTFGVGGTGFSGKWLEILREAAPAVSRVAILANSANAFTMTQAAEAQDAAKKLNLSLETIDAAGADNLDAVFSAIASGGAQGLIVCNDPFFVENRRKLVRFAADKRLPAVYFTKLFVDAGGLISYGGSLEDSYRRAATHVDRILKGAKPGELPVDQPTRFELIVNLKAAKTIGLKIPQSLLLRADQIIE